MDERYKDMLLTKCGEENYKKLVDLNNPSEPEAVNSIVVPSHISYISTAQDMIFVKDHLKPNIFFYLLRVRLILLLFCRRKKPIND